ncbi:MAG: hypothetical protein AAB368_06980 [bacterium]
MIRATTVLLAALWLGPSARAASPVPAEQAAFGPTLEVAETPTAETMYGRMFHLGVRTYPGGGLLTRGVASFNNSLMLGVSFKADNVIGYGSPTFDSRPVDAIVKLKVLGLPGAQIQGALGYDGIAYGGAAVPAIGARRGRGLYGVLTKDLGMSSLVFQLHGGVGVNQYKAFSVKDDVNVFGAVTGSLTPELIVGLEYDDVLHKERQANASVGYNWDMGLRVEIDFMKLFHGVHGHYRVLKILYTF